MLEARLELAQRFAKQSRPRSGCSMEDCGFSDASEKDFLTSFDIGSTLTVARWLILSGGVAHKGPYIGVNSEAGQSLFLKRSFSRHARVLQPSSTNLIL